MKAKFANGGFRLAVVFATLMGWLVLSNHCALASFAMKAPSEPVHRCCQQPDSQNDPAPPPDRPAQCCKSLHVLVPDVAKAPDASGPLLVVLPLIWEVGGHLAALQPSTPALETSPPPDSPSFAELVLHRSMQSHAPPVA